MAGHACRWWCSRPHSALGRPPRARRGSVQRSTRAGRTPCSPCSPRSARCGRSESAVVAGCLCPSPTRRSCGRRAVSASPTAPRCRSRRGMRRSRWRPASPRPGSCARPGSGSSGPSTRRSRETSRACAARPTLSASCGPTRSPTPTSSDASTPVARAMPPCSTPRPPFPQRRLPDVRRGRRGRRRRSPRRHGHRPPRCDRGRVRPCHRPLAAVGRPLRPGDLPRPPGRGRRPRLGSPGPGRAAAVHGPRGPACGGVRAGRPRDHRSRHPRRKGRGGVRGRRRRRAPSARRRARSGDVVLAEPSVRAVVVGDELPLGARVRVRLAEASVSERRVTFTMAV